MCKVIDFKTRKVVESKSKCSVVIVDSEILDDNVYEFVRLTRLRDKINNISNPVVRKVVKTVFTFFCEEEIEMIRQEIADELKEVAM